MENGTGFEVSLLWQTVGDRKGISVAFRPKISAETASFCRKALFRLVSVFLQKGYFFNVSLSAFGREEISLSVAHWQIPTVELE